MCACLIAGRVFRKRCPLPVGKCRCLVLDKLLTFRGGATGDSISSRGNDLSSGEVDSSASQKHGKGDVDDDLEERHVEHIRLDWMG